LLWLWKITVLVLGLSCDIFLKLGCEPARSYSVIIFTVHALAGIESMQGKGNLAAMSLIFTPTYEVLCKALEADSLVSYLEAL